MPMHLHRRLLLYFVLSALLHLLRISQPQTNGIPCPLRCNQLLTGRTVILIVVVITVVVLIGAGYDPYTAVAVVAACGVVASGTARQLLGPPPVSPCSSAKCPCAC